MNTPEQINHDVDYFISFFEAIPDEKWCTYSTEDEYGGRCALGHCGANNGHVHTLETDALAGLFRNHFACLTHESAWLKVGEVNDGVVRRYTQPTPKLRILAALRDIKAAQDAAKPAPVVHECAHMWCGGQCLYCCILQPQPINELAL